MHTEMIPGTMEYGHKCEHCDRWASLRDTIGVYRWEGPRRAWEPVARRRGGAYLMWACRDCAYSGLGETNDVTLHDALKRGSRGRAS